MSKQLDLLAANSEPETLEITASAADLKWSEVEAADGGEKVPQFSMVGYTGGAMRVGGFAIPVVVDLAGVKASQTIPIVRNHDLDRIIGHGTPTISESGIDVEGIVSADNDDSREVTNSSRRGFPWQSSIGASVQRWEKIADGKQVTVNGKTFTGPLLVARESTLNETSFVTLGADRGTSARVAASSAGTGATNMTLTKDTTFAEWVAAQDCEVETLSAKAKAIFEAQFQAEKAKLAPAPNPHGDRFIKTLEAEKAEKARVDAIDAIAMHAIKAYPTQLDTIDEMVRAAHADKTCEPKDFELQMLRAMTPVGPSNLVSKRDGEIGGQVIEAAICKTLNMRDIEKHFDERTLTATDKYFRHGMGLQQLLFKAAAANGQHFDSAADIDSLLRAAFGTERSHIQATGFSTISLPGIMGNVFNKLLRDQWNAVESVWRQIAAIRSARDFRQFTTYALTGDLKFEKLGADGEIKHGTLGEGEYTNRVETHARMLAITRQDIINDDLGAFERIPRRLGRGGALALNEAFWTEFLDNSSFFAAGNSNVNTGADSALDATGSAIGAAEQVFSALTDPDGNPLGIMPRILLVPPTLLNTAAAVMGGQLIVGGNTAISNANVYQGRYRVVSSVYMENSNLTGNSAAAWYLLADPNDLPVIEVAFLNGRQTPTVDRAEADFHQLGIQIRAYFDFGVSLQEPRAGVRSAGS